MITFVGNRQYGKTTAAIERSRVTGFPILTSNQVEADSINQYAKMNNINIPPATNVSEYLRILKLGYGKSNLILDNVEAILTVILGARVDTMTLNSETTELQVLV